MSDGPEKPGGGSAKRTWSDRAREAGANAMDPVCPYCLKQAAYIDNSCMLHHGRDYGPQWVCIACQAWVGCHKGTSTPMGRLANAELRRAKMEAHREFDEIWRRKAERDGVSANRARTLAYRWLAKKMEIAARDCHIGMMDLEQVAQVVAICKPYADRIRESRLGHHPEPWDGQEITHRD